MVGGKVYRVPPINTVEWEVKKALFDKAKNYKRKRRETILDVFRGG